MQQLHPARLKESFLFPQITSDQFDEALANAASDNINSMIELQAAVASYYFRMPALLATPFSNIGVVQCQKI